VEELWAELDMRVGCEVVSEGEFFVKIFPEFLGKINILGVLLFNGDFVVFFEIIKLFGGYEGFSL
jgi:hypothetical protein